MHLTMLKAKLHRVTITHAELDYEGSCAIDADLLDASGIREFEKVDVYNIANGERFSTYAIRAEAGSGIISLNGAAAHKGKPGELAIICAYVTLDEKEVARFQPRLVYVDTANRVRRIGDAIPEQAA
jgi:aspartate 1-decarboxylase